MKSITVSLEITIHEQPGWLNLLNQSVGLNQYCTRVKEASLQFGTMELQLLTKNLKSVMYFPVMKKSPTSFYNCNKKIELEKEML